MEFFYIFSKSAVSTSSEMLHFAFQRNHILIEIRDIVKHNYVLCISNKHIGSQITHLVLKVLKMYAFNSRKS